MERGEYQESQIFNLGKIFFKLLPLEKGQSPPTITKHKDSHALQVPYFFKNFWFCKVLISLYMFLSSSFHLEICMKVSCSKLQIFPIPCPLLIFSIHKTKDSICWLKLIKKPRQVFSTFKENRINPPKYIIK